MPTITLGTNRQMVLPKKLCDALGLAPGDDLEVALDEGNRLLVTPKALVDTHPEIDQRLAAAEEDSTMALIPKQMAWGGIVGVTLLGCIAGCSLKDASVLQPSVSHAPTKTAPAPVLRAPAPQAHEAAPADKPTITQIGTASWYGPGFHGRETASGATFNQHALTAAHRTLPLGTEAKVTNLETGQSVQVTINDRGPYVPGRHLDLSRAAATQIGLMQKGVAKVKIEAKPPRQASSDAQRRGTRGTARPRSTASRRLI